MRIAYVCTDRGIPMPGEKGAYSHIKAIVSSLARLGHEVILFRVEGEGPVPGASRMVRVRAGRAAGEMRAFLRGTEHAQAGKELWSLFLNSELGRLLRQEHERAPLDAVVERLSVWSFAAPAVCEELAIPHVLEVNARVVTEQGAHFAIALEEGAHAVHRFLAARTGAVLCVSELLAEDYRALTTAPVRALPNGVDLELFRPDARWRPRPDWAAEGTVAVGFVGTMKPFHDLTAVAEAALRLPARFRIVMAGEGPGLARLAESEAAREGRIVLLGRIDHSEVPGFLGWCRIGLAPTATGYGYLSPLKLPEYLAMGLPVVVGAGGQGQTLLPEHVREVYAPGDAGSLAGAIERIASRLDADPEGVAAAARAAGVGRSWDLVAGVYVETIEALRRIPRPEAAH